MVCIFAEDGSV